MKRDPDHRPWDDVTEDLHERNQLIIHLLYEGIRAVPLEDLRDPFDIESGRVLVDARPVFHLLAERPRACLDDVVEVLHSRGENYLVEWPPYPDPASL